MTQGYCWLENVRGHFAENSQPESLSPISLHYKISPLFQNEGAILIIKGQFCPWPLPNLSLMTKMAAMPIYGKNPSKIFFSRTSRPISTKLGMEHRWLKHYNMYINHDPVMTLTYFTARST